MSRESYEGVVKAIETHIADVTQDSYVGDFLVTVSLERPDKASETSYVYIHSRGTPLHALRGLADFAVEWTKRVYGSQRSE